MTQNDDQIERLRVLIDEGEKSGPPVEIRADSFLEASREDRLKLLQNELIKGEQSGMTNGPVDIGAINAEIDQELQAEQ